MTASDTILEINGKTYLQNPQGQIMDIDGHTVAVAFSPGYGSGWSTSYGPDPTNPTVIRALLENRSLTQEELKSLEYPYTGGYKNLVIEWYPAGTWIKINEYDGSEYIEMGYEDDDIFLHPSSTRQQELKREALEKVNHDRHLKQWDAIAKEMYQQVASDFQDSLRVCMGYKTFFLPLPVARTIPYFRVLLDSGFKESTDKTSRLEIRTPNIADYFIEFVYRGRMGVGYTEHKDELLSLADMLQYDHLLQYLDELASN
jgi:hypothetical protein